MANNKSEANLFTLSELKAKKPESCSEDEGGCEDVREIVEMSGR